MDEYLTKEEEVELVKRAQAGDVEARNAVILTVDKWIWKHAIRYAGRANIDLAEEYHHTAVARLCEKFHQYDLAMGTRFTTWASWWIRASMQRYKYENLPTVRVPYYLLKGEELPDGDVRKPLAEQARRLVSMQAKLSDNNGKGKDCLLGDMVADRKVVPPAVQLAREEQSSWVSEVLGKLDARSRQIVQLRYYEGLTLGEVGEAMGVTRERVRQLETRIFEKFARQADRLHQPRVAEFEQEVRDRAKARRFAWKTQAFQPRGSAVMAEGTTRGNAELKRQLMDDAVRRLGQDAKYRDIKQAVADAGGYPGNVLDCDIAKSRRRVFGDAAIATNGCVKKKPEPTLSLLEVKRLAMDMGGFEVFHGELSRLRELQGKLAVHGGIDRVCEALDIIQQIRA